MHAPDPRAHRVYDNDEVGDGDAETTVIVWDGYADSFPVGTARASSTKCSKRLPRLNAFDTTFSSAEAASGLIIVVSVFSSETGDDVTAAAARCASST